MVNKLVKCGLAGGIILFIWGAFFWKILPWHVCQRNHFTNESEVAKVIKNNAPVSGIYVLPTCDTANSPEAMQQVMTKMQEGPYIFASVALKGKNANVVRLMAQSFIFKVIIAGFVAWLLLQTQRLGYKGSVKFVLVAGVALALAATIPYCIWFGFSGAFSFCLIIESVIGWLFAGLAMAKLAMK